jgi:UDP-N-acetylmuramoyl-tripeptide--D-alanyl-D-alanine ligase
VKSATGSHPSPNPSSHPSFYPSFTPKFVSGALNQAPGGGRPLVPQPFTSITTDSRKIQPGSLFIALKGENFDGHDFVEKAVQTGATGVLCRRGFPAPIQSNVTVFQVEDTLTAYRQLAARWRREFAIPIVAVAGSVGKTTTKELLAAILRGKYEQVLKTEGSQNGYVGIPMTLLELRHTHGAAVVEVGIDEIGAMEKHIALVAPTASVLTAIGPEHLEKLIDLPTVAREEGLALTGVAQTGGLVAINLDDAWIRPHFRTIRAGRKIGYTLKNQSPPSGATGEILHGALSSDGSSVIVKGETYTLPLPGSHNASNLMTAITVALSLGLTPDEIRKGLLTFKGPSGRSELKQLPGNRPVICDYYNANPTSVEAGLEMLTRSKRDGLRWACLGDMLELGPDEEKFHRDLAGPIAQLGIEHVLLYGPRMKALSDELESRKASGKFAGDVRHLASHAEIAEVLLGGARSGDSILLKGSHGMKMEEVWKILETQARTRWS